MSATLISAGVATVPGMDSGMYAGGGGGGGGGEFGGFDGGMGGAGGASRASMIASTLNPAEGYPAQSIGNQTLVENSQWHARFKTIIKHTLGLQIQ